MEVQTVKNQYVVGVRFRKRDFVSGRLGKIMSNCYARGGSVHQGVDEALRGVDWSNRQKVAFTFRTKRDAERFGTWVRNGCK